MKEAQSLSDNVSKAATARIGFEYDFVAAADKFHKDCYEFLLEINHWGKVGSPRDRDTNLAMVEIYSY